MWWIWFPYVACLVLVVYVSNKLATYVDALDKKTKLTGAFLGGVLLAGITSIPELVTSITAALMNQPEMTLGNILGSDIFDIAIIGLLMIIFASKIRGKGLTKGNIFICAFTLIVAVAIMLVSVLNIRLVIPGINVNILTPMILVLYFVALYVTQGDEKEEKPEEDGEKSVAIQKVESYSVKKILGLFTVCAVVLVGVSIAMTFMVDAIANEYNLGKGIAGALFLGIATSLPEIVSTFSLVKLGNFDAGYGNIIGSCFFNFLVIAIADIFYFKDTVFLTDAQSIILGACLSVACATLLVFSLIRKSKQKISNSMPIQITSGAIITLSYLAFLILSALI